MKDYIKVRRHSEVSIWFKRNSGSLRLIGGLVAIAIIGSMGVA